MHTSNSVNHTHRALRRESGTTLLEVLLAIVIFVVGMLALAQLQGNLARSSSDANLRTVAASIAEELIEDMRSFQGLGSDPDNPGTAYADVVDQTITRTRGGVVYTVDVDVSDQYFLADGVSLTDDVGDLPEGRDTTYSDFKLVDMTVTWAAPDFQVDNEGSESGLGSGSVRIINIVPSLSGLGGAKIAAEDDGLPGTPPVTYTPGDLPDIVAIGLDNNKFKETSTPEPDVIRQDELVESWWEVVTYSQVEGEDATFLRREEFLAVSCECTLRAPGTGDGGLRPTVWQALEYSDEEPVDKAWGESASNQNSQYCDICCRDHHDGGSDAGENLYDPWKGNAEYHVSGAFSGDHLHYSRNNQGNLALADDDGDGYLEACRMVRKDGFMRVVHDLQQQALYGFPADYLDDSSDADGYASYMTQAALNYISGLGCADADNCSDYHDDQQQPVWPLVEDPIIESPAPETFPASTVDDPTTIPLNGATTQQLRSRGNYMDYLSAETREAINCLDQNGGDGDGCGLPGINSVLEVVPFWDVQLTFLNRWAVMNSPDSVAVTNDAVADDNGHSRGVASQNRFQGQWLYGVSDVQIVSHPGNLGLTATEGIDPGYTSALEEYHVFVDVPTDDGEEPPPPPGAVNISGSLNTSVNGFKVADVVASGTGASCQRPTDTTWTCVLTNLDGSATITLSGLTKGNASYYACNLSGQALNPVSTGPGTATYVLPLAQPGSPITFTIQAATCP